MAFVPPKDRVLEHSTSNSQTVFAVTGAVDTSFNAFSASMSVGDTTVGGVVEAGVAFKSGILTYSAANEITVSTTKESKGTFSAGGVKEVFMGQPASVALAFDGVQSFTAGQKMQARSNIGMTDGQLPGTATNDSASAGNVGELIESTVLTASAVSLTNGVEANITSISLTAGNWMVWGIVIFKNAGGGTTSTDHIAWISSTSATLPTQPNSGSYNRFSGATLTNSNISLPTGHRNLKLSGTTTIYLSALAAFGVSTLSAYGYIGAVRIR